MHRMAEEMEATRLASRSNGGIRQAFSARVMIQRRALIGALHLVYWLAGEEVAHTTKFNSLKEFTIKLGCDYLKELNLGRNAQYTSEQIVSELLQSLSQVSEEKILSDMQSCEYFSMMTDESTDIAVLKQLVLVGRYLTDDGIKASFLHIGDIVNGTDEAIEQAIMQYLHDKLYVTWEVKP